MSLPPTAVNDGKYTFSIPEGDYKIHVLRYGKPWLIIEQGSNAIFSILSELIDSRELISTVMQTHGQPAVVRAAVEKFCGERGLPVPETL